MPPPSSVAASRARHSATSSCESSTRPDVGGEDVERRLLQRVGGAPDDVRDGDHLVVEVRRRVRRAEIAGVHEDPGDHDHPLAEVAQQEVEIGGGEAAQPLLLHDQIALIDLGDELDPARALDHVLVEQGRGLTAPLEDPAPGGAVVRRIVGRAPAQRAAGVDDRDPQLARLAMERVRRLDRRDAALAGRARALRRIVEMAADHVDRDDRRLARVEEVVEPLVDPASPPSGQRGLNLGQHPALLLMHRDRRTAVTG